MARFVQFVVMVTEGGGWECKWVNADLIVSASFSKSSEGVFRLVLRMMSGEERIWEHTSDRSMFQFCRELGLPNAMADPDEPANSDGSDL